MEARDELFFRLLRFVSGTDANCPKMHLREWRTMFLIAKKQALTGFIGTALKNIGGDVLIESDAKSQDAFTDLIMDWMGEVVKIARRNQKVNKDVVEEFNLLETKGLQYCLLKGQGNALMYPNPDSRTSGDIDVWVRFKGSLNTDANIRRIIQIVKSEKPDSKATYHHIDATDINGTPVEVHYRPQFLFCLAHEKRLQKFFIDKADEQFLHKVNLDGDEVAVPTTEFNIVFQLSHIYNHLFHEGIGLRQIVDYYYVSKEYASSNVSTEKHDTIPNFSRALRSMGLSMLFLACFWSFNSNLTPSVSLCLFSLHHNQGHTSFGFSP